jgi:ABC-type glycerol-3-phosphate transport system substrate-binding protein
MLRIRQPRSRWTFWPAEPVTKTFEWQLSRAKAGYCHDAWAEHYVSAGQSGHLLPLDDYIKKYNLDKRILTPVLRTGEYNGHNYALPRTFETRSF